MQRFKSIITERLKIPFFFMKISPTLNADQNRLLLGNAVNDPIWCVPSE